MTKAKDENPKTEFELSRELIAANSMTLRRVAGLLEAVATLLDRSTASTDSVLASSLGVLRRASGEAPNVELPPPGASAHPDATTKKMPVSAEFLAELSRATVESPIPPRKSEGAIVEVDPVSNPTTRKMGSGQIVPPGVRQPIVTFNEFVPDDDPTEETFTEPR